MAVTVQENGTKAAGVERKDGAEEIKAVPAKPVEEPKPVEVVPEAPQPVPEVPAVPEVAPQPEEPKPEEPKPEHVEPEEKEEPTREDAPSPTRADQIKHMLQELTTATKSEEESEEEGEDVKIEIKLDTVISLQASIRQYLARVQYLAAKDQVMKRKQELEELLKVYVGCDHHPHTTQRHHNGFLMLVLQKPFISSYHYKVASDCKRKDREEED